MATVDGLKKDNVELKNKVTNLVATVDRLEKKVNDLEENVTSLTTTLNKLGCAVISAS